MRNYGKQRRQWTENGRDQFHSLRPYINTVQFGGHTRDIYHTWMEYGSLFWSKKKRTLAEVGKSRHRSCWLLCMVGVDRWCPCSDKPVCESISPVNKMNFFRLCEKVLLLTNIQFVVCSSPSYFPSSHFNYRRNWASLQSRSRIRLRHTWRAMINLSWAPCNIHMYHIVYDRLYCIAGIAIGQHSCQKWQ